MNKIINRVKNIKYFEYFILSLILVTGFVVRLYKLNNPIADWHSWRQADTASVSKIYVQKGINLLLPRYHDISSIQTGIFNPNGYRMVEFPLYNAIHAVLTKSFPVFSLEVWGRLLSIISWAVSTYLLFLIGRKYLGKWGGILAAFFFSFIPYNVYFTRVILPEPLSETFALLSLWLLITFVDKDQWPWLFLSAGALAVSLLIKPSTFFYFIPAAYLIFNKYKNTRTIIDTPWLLVKLFIYLAICLLPVLGWRIWINQYPAGIPFFEWAFNGDRIRFRPAFWRWIFAERIGRLILGIWGLFPFLLGAIVKRKNYFTLSFMVGALVYLTVFATASIRHDYYQIFVIPPISLLLAEGSLFLWNSRVFSLRLSRTILVFSIVLMLGLGAYQIKEDYKINHPEIIAAGKVVDKITPKDALVIAPYNGDTAFLYQTNRWGWPAVDDSIDNLIGRGAGYYVSVDLGSPDTQLVTSRFETIIKTGEYLIVDLNKPLKK